MSDPQNPTPPAVPPAGGEPTYQPPAAPPAPPAYGAPSASPAYGAAPAYDPNAPAGAQAPYGAPDAPVPGKTLGIVAFVVSFFFALLGLILGIVAFLQSKKAGVKNGWALAAIILSSVLMVLGIILGIVFFSTLFPIVNACAELGPGEWQLSNGQVLDCD